MTDNQKPLPILAHMPPHIIQKIIGNLEYLDKISLKNSNFYLRRTIKTPRIVADVKMKYKGEEAAVVKFICDDYWLEKTKKYIKNEQGWMINTIYELDGRKKESTIQGGADLVEMMVQDFKSILATPMLTLRWFRFEFKKSHEIGIVPRIRDILNALEPKLKAQKVYLYTNKQEDVLEILPLLNPDALKNFLNDNHDPTPDPSFSTATLEVERFPNVTYWNLFHLSDILPVESWWNLPFVCLHMDLSFSPTRILPELPRILQHFRQMPNFVYCDLEFASSKQELKNAIRDITVGPWDVDGDYETCYLPAEGSNLKLYCEVSDQRIVFMRTNRGEAEIDEDDSDAWDDCRLDDDTDYSSA